MRENKNDIEQKSRSMEDLSYTLTRRSNQDKCHSKVLNTLEYVFRNTVTGFIHLNQCYNLILNTSQKMLCSGSYKVQQS